MPVKRMRIGCITAALLGGFYFWVTSPKQSEAGSRKAPARRWR